MTRYGAYLKLSVVMNYIVWHCYINNCVRSSHIYIYYKLNIYISDRHKQMSNNVQCLL